MKYQQLLEQTCAQISEIMPWDYEDYLADQANALIVDVRETHEYEALRLKDSITVPRGILENACSWSFAETVPEFASAQNRPVLLVCRSGHRSAFAALSLKQLGFELASSLKLGLKGLNDEDYPIFNALDEQLDGDQVDQWLTPAVSKAQSQTN